MNELVEFLRARLDEDEQNARRAQAIWPSTHFTVEPGSIVIMQYLRDHDPARVLADIGAKRKLLAYYQGIVDYQGGEPMEDTMRAVREVSEIALDMAVKLLAVPYASHPDYREEWRP